MDCALLDNIMEHPSKCTDIQYTTVSDTWEKQCPINFHRLGIIQHLPEG